MKYVPMQTGMWAVFAGSFRKNLEAVFDLDPKTAGAVTAAAKKQYRRILRELPDFEKGDRFLMNIVSCAMLAAFILSMPERPNVERLREYYERSMMTPAVLRLLPQERQPDVYAGIPRRHEIYRAVPRCRPQPVLLEYGLF